MSREKVLIAMSGGVDSSVAAGILARDYEVLGLHITKFELPGISEEVRARDAENLASARRSAETLGVPLRVVEAGPLFNDLVDWFCDAYNRGETPNPCVRCNATLKWRLLISEADAAGARFVATGHYARIGEQDGAFHILRGRGGDKDQTYFLHRLTQPQVLRTLFPLAGLAKPETKALAREMSITAVERPESQDICFMDSEGYRGILQSRTPAALRPGEVVDTEGRVVGKHEAFQFYTIGQRKGVRIALGSPAYVVGIDPSTARIILGRQEHLERSHLTAVDVNWIVGPPPSPFDATVRIRYSHRGAPARVTLNGDTARVEFSSPVRAVTPGQAAVFYSGDYLLGGGWIARE